MQKPTEAELDILKVLWDNGSSTVRTVNEKQNETRKVGYTTTLKLMQIMVEKGLLSVDKHTRTHIYTPLLKKEDTQSIMIKNLVDKVFSGSASNLVLQALGNHKTSQKELEEIKKLIDDIEQKSK
jgi:BlaI family penicillinase repressor